MSAAVNDFLDRTSDWERHLEIDEWFFAKLRDSLLSRLTPSDAFDAIDEFVPHVLSASDPYLCLEYVVVLDSLARHSNTTQVPPKLDGCWTKLVQHIESVGPDGVKQLKGLRS